MSEWKTFRYLLKGHRADVVVLLITFFLTVVLDLTVAIEFGVILAIILFVKRVSETSSIKVIDNEMIEATELSEFPQDVEKYKIPKSVEVYEIDGPFFFGLASKIDELDVSTHRRVKIRIIRMRKVPFIDSTGLNNLRNLYKRSKKEHIQVILSGVTESVRNSLDSSGFSDELGQEYIFPHISLAVEKANELAAKIAETEKEQAEKRHHKAKTE